MHKELTCIVCPMGCRLEIELDDYDQPLSISGNLCIRGKDYALKEIIAPERVLTTTIKTKKGVFPLVSVRSDKPLPKASIFAVMNIINNTGVQAPINIHDILIENILDLGVNIIATSTNPLKD